MIIMLTAHHLYKSYNLDTILEDVSFSIGPGERVGLIGPNGCGKATLIRILAGLDAPDRGHVSLMPFEMRIGYMPQSLETDAQVTVGQLIRSIDSDSTTAEEEPLSRELLPLLAVLDLDTLEENQSVMSLSGGQKTRLSLALVLYKQPNLLLLDEPTNHLDIAMLEWIENWISGYPGAALIVSHDRTFLDQSVTRILFLDPITHAMRQYNGNYSDYLGQYLAERKRHIDSYRDQVEIVRGLKKDINRTKQQAARVEQTTTPRQPGVRRIAKKVARKAKSREKKLERFVESDERLDKPVAGWQMKLEFGRPPGKGEPHHRLGRDVLSTWELSVGYPGHRALLQDLNVQIHANRRIAFTGPNGSGKTTLLRTIAGQLLPLTGEIHLGQRETWVYASRAGITGS
jgi:ATP-binding cassette subfamily F protein 3